MSSDLLSCSSFGPWRAAATEQSVTAVGTKDLRQRFLLTLQTEKSVTERATCSTQSFMLGVEGGPPRFLFHVRHGGQHPGQSVGKKNTTFPSVLFEYISYQLMSELISPASELIVGGNMLSSLKQSQVQLLLKRVLSHPNLCFSFFASIMDFSA